MRAAASAKRYPAGPAWSRLRLATDTCLTPRASRPCRVRPGCARPDPPINVAAQLRASSRYDATTRGPPAPGSTIVLLDSLPYPFYSPTHRPRMEVGPVTAYRLVEVTVSIREDDEAAAQRMAEAVVNDLARAGVTSWWTHGRPISISITTPNIVLDDGGHDKGRACCYAAEPRA